MKNLLRALALSAAALPALQSAAAWQQPAAAPSAQEQQAKTDLYNKWLNNRKGDPAAQKTANEAGKEYLQKYGADNDEYVTAVRKWVEKYEAATAGFDRQKKFGEAVKQAETAKTYAPLFVAGKEIVTAEPDNFPVLLTLANAGYLNAARKKEEIDQSLLPDTVTYTRRLLEQVEAGKGTPAEFKLVNPAAADKDSATAWLNYRLGFLLRDSAPEESVNHLLKVAQGSTAVKSEPSLYSYLAQAYSNGEYQKLAADYKARFEGKEATDESKLAAAKLEQVLDRVIDAYARAVALSTKTDPASANFKTAVTAQLTDLYKQRNNGSDAGLQELISGSATRRLPLPTDPPPTLPVAAPTATSTATPAATPAASPSPAPTPKP